MGKVKKAAVSSQLSAPTSSLNWPPLPRFAESTLETLLPGEIVLLHALFTAKDCQAFVDFCSTLPLEPSPAAKRGEATRTNDRFSAQQPEFAQRLWAETNLSKLLPSVIGDKACGLNSNIRVYRYDSRQQAYFQPHYDDTVQDAVTGLRSKWTLLIYLTGNEDGVRGGQTVFYKSQKKEAATEVVFELERGAALLHKHGADCLLHEARPVLEGVKWVLRSDVMFAR